MNILQTFSRNHKQIIAKIETAWQNQNQEEVISLVHSLKGSAAGIGAAELHGLANDLEQMCRKEGCLPSLEKAIILLKDSLAIVLASIKDLGNQQTSENKETTPLRMDYAKTDSLLIQLEKALEFPELGELETLIKALESVFDHPLMADLKTHIAYYDHDLAKESVKKLQSILKAVIP